MRWRTFFWILIVVSWAWIGQQVGSDQLLGWALASLQWAALVMVWAYAMVLPHELAHAGVARIAGLRVDWIAVGRPPHRWQVDWLGTRWKLSRLPLAGHVAASFPGPLPRLWRLRLASLILAGPGVHFALVIALELALARTESPGLALILDAGWWANAALLVMNLNPFGGKAGQSTDGAQLLTLLDAKQAAGLWRSAGSRHQALLRHEAGDHAGALALLQGVQQAPGDDLALDLMIGALLGATHAIDDAMAAYEAVLATPELSPAMRVLASNDLAWFLAILGRDLDRADALSQHAVDARPGEAAVHSTRGAVLVRLGRLEEGRAELERSLQSPLKAQDRASILSFLALAEPERAPALLAEARALDPDGVAVVRVGGEAGQEV